MTAPDENHDQPNSDYVTGPYVVCGVTYDPAKQAWIKWKSVDGIVTEWKEEMTNED